MAGETGTGMAHAFQPIWDLRSGEILGFEALARPADGTPPARLWEEARAAGGTVALDRNSISAAAHASRALPGLLFVNMAASTLATNEPPSGTIKDALRAAGRVERTVCEITEDGLLTTFSTSLDHAQQRLARIALLGMRVALDDAGAGESGWERIALLQTALGFVKLDRALVNSWLAGRFTLLPEWVLRAEAAGVPCIAEGVEEPERACALAAAGIAYVQGYAFGIPAPASSWTPERLEQVRPRLPARVV